MQSVTFEELGLNQSLLEAIRDQGFESPAAIQSLAIPAALEGKDLVGLSQTGSGKTAAFALPALQSIALDKVVPQVLILCPTRELALQVCEDLHTLGAHLPGLKAIPVYGGASLERQTSLLRRGVHAVIGTPGRVLDHLRRGNLRPAGIHCVVLDEADRMLDMGFQEEVESLLGQIPSQRQTLFFSATMNAPVQKLIQRHSREPFVVEVERSSLTVESIEQVHYAVRNRSKVEVLSRILDLESPRLAIVFCNTKRAVDDCTEALLARGYTADRLHGDISQAQRERVIGRFREAAIELLVATDVAARGLDVENVDIVFNFDLPQDPEDYVHRIGRTARAGRSGKACSFVYGRDHYRLQNIEKFISQRIPRARIPTQERVEGRRADLVFEAVQECLEEATYEDQQDYLDRLLDQGHTVADISSALFSMLRAQLARDSEPIEEDRSPKSRRSRPSSDDAPRPADSPGGQARSPSRDNDFTTLFLNVGKASGASPGEIAGMIYSEASLPKGAVGRIRLLHRHSLVDVGREFADRVLQQTRGARMKGVHVFMDHAR